MHFLTINTTRILSPSIQKQPEVSGSKMNRISVSTQALSLYLHFQYILLNTEYTLDRYLSSWPFSVWPRLGMSRKLTWKRNWRWMILIAPGPRPLVPLGPLPLILGAKLRISVLNIGLGIHTVMIVWMMRPMALMEVTVVEIMSEPGFAEIANAKSNFWKCFFWIENKTDLFYSACKIPWRLLFWKRKVASSSLNFSGP